MRYFFNFFKKSYVRIAKRKQTRGGGIPFPKPLKLVLWAAFFMASTDGFIARLSLEQDKAINSWKYSWQNLLFHSLPSWLLSCFWLVSHDVGLITKYTTTKFMSNSTNFVMVYFCMVSIVLQKKASRTLLWS